ncbi:MAG: RDD family protein, partial [Anaerolineales bacterium]|nr:RDD family protein [Anaerolineales bacterium]
RRGIAYTIDVVILFAVLAPFAFLVEWGLAIDPASGVQIWMAAVLSFSLPAWTYFALSDWSVGGATLGKRLLKIRVVKDDSPEKLSLGRAVGRTAVKLLPWEIVHTFGFALIGVVPEWVQMGGLVVSNVLLIVYLGVAAVTHGRKSVHDFVVGTAVERQTHLQKS